MLVLFLYAYHTGVVGIVTDRDIVVRNVAHGKTPHDTKTGDNDITGYDCNTRYGY